MARMLRYEVPVDDEWHTIDLPWGTSIAHVGCRDAEVVEFWAMACGDHDTPRTFKVVGTGQPFGLHEGMYQGTAVAPGGRLVWHLLERNPRLAEATP